VSSKAFQAQTKLYDKKVLTNLKKGFSTISHKKIPFWES